MQSKLPKKKFFGEGATNKLMEGQIARENYNQTVLVSTEKPLGELKLENCKVADNLSDGAIDTKDIKIDDKDVQGGDDYQNQHE